MPSWLTNVWKPFVPARLTHADTLKLCVVSITGPALAMLDNVTSIVFVTMYPVKTGEAFGG